MLRKTTQSRHLEGKWNLSFSKRLLSISHILVDHHLLDAEGDNIIKQEQKL
jgi:hypothetical protein